MSVGQRAGYNDQPFAFGRKYELSIHHFNILDVASRATITSSSLYARKYPSAIS